MVLDSLLSIVIWIIILGNFSLGLLVFIKNHHKAVYINLSILAFLSAFWAMSLYLYQHPFIGSSYIWLKIVYCTVIFLVSSLFSLSFFFPFSEYKKKSLLIPTLICVTSGSFFLYTIIFTNLFLADVYTKADGPQQVLGALYPLFGLWATIICGWAAVNYFKNYKISTGLQKLQLKYLFLGVFLFSLIPIILDVFYPIVLKNSSYIWFSPVSSVFLVGFTSYAIIRHRLMDIRIALQGIIEYLITAVLVSLSILLGAIIFWNFSNQLIKTEVIYLIFVIGFVLTLLFHRISSLAKKISSQYLFQSSYDYQKTLKDLSLSLSSYLEMPRLVDIIIDVLLNTMRLNRVAVLVRDFSDNHYKIQKTIGFDEDNGISIVKDNFLTTYLEVHSQIIVLDELKSLIEETPNPNEKDKLEQLYEHMIHIEAALVVPVVNTKKVISLLVLGNKLSGDPYSVQDIDLLHTIASQASIAIENARLYKEIADLNQSLEQKVERAISELEKKNQDLERAYQDLKVLDKLKDDFVSVVSHELRTPMTAIRSYVWMAINRADIPLSERLKKYLSRTLISTERLINLVNDMLNVSRLEAGRIEIRLQAFNISNLVNDVLIDIGPKAKEKDIEIKVFGQTMPSVYADPNKVREVLLNLIGNSIKFTPDDGLIDIGFAMNGSSIIVSVKDSGVGLSRDDIPRLFQRFGRLDNSYVAAATSCGTGLGLYISKNLVRLMNGEIWATSDGIGTGSTFSFSLPIATQSQLFSPKPPENPTITADDLKTEPVVI
jgi:signal transduction histidine kinase